MPGPYLTPGDVLRPVAGDVLSSTNAIRSSNGVVYAVLLSDGNFIVYQTATSARLASFNWMTRTSGAGNYLVFQTDYNLVLFSSAGAQLWSSVISADNTHRCDASCRLTIQDDCATTRFEPLAHMPG